MLGILKESFRITNKFIVQLALPIMLFSLFSTLYLIFSVNGNMLSLIFSIILFLLMLGAFISGWLYMIKDCIKNADLEDKKLSLTDFPTGVGEYFLPSLGLIVNTLIIGGLFFYVAQLIGNHYIGDIGITVESLRNAQMSPEKAKLFYESLTSEQITKFSLWLTLSLITTTLNGFLFMFYSPALLNKSKNPYKALLISLKDLFSRKFFKNVLMFVLILISYFVLVLISELLNINFFTQFIFNLINFYYVVLVTVSVFNYYYNNYVKIGSQVDIKI